MIDLPEQVAELAKVLAAMPGAVAVALGGSRALGVGDADSDWDFGLYYRGRIDLAALTARGTVHPPGAWGRLFNGGAFLRCGTAKVDVALPDCSTRAGSVTVEQSSDDHPEHKASGRGSRHGN